MSPPRLLSQSSRFNKGISLKMVQSPRVSTSIKKAPFHSFIQSSKALCTPAHCFPNTQASGLTCTSERSLACPVPGCPPSKAGQPAGQGHGRFQRQSSCGLNWPRVEGEMCCLAPQRVHLGLTSVEVCPGAPTAVPGEPGPAAAAAQPPAGSSPAPCRVPPGPRLGPPSP